MSLDIDSTPAASSTMSAEGTAERVVRLRRETSETRIALRLSVGDGRAKVATTNAFLDHMLVTFARYTGVDLELDASGDLTHHLVEDVAITLGEALRRFVPPTAARYGDRVVPMDDALVHVAVDLRSEEHTSELQSRENLVCRLLLEKKKPRRNSRTNT